MTALAAPVVLSVEHLSFSYGQHLALDDVSFDVPTGAMFGLLGPNGGGKSTLFRLLATLLPVRQGRIEVAGFDVKSHPAEVRSRLGVTFQSPSLDNRLTVRENLQYQGYLYGLHGSELRSRIDTICGWLGVHDRLRQRVQTLSGGLKRRVEVAKSLLHRPRLLILDEPSTGLDPAARQELAESLHKIRRDEGVTILVTTHLMDEAERCHALVLLDRGRIVASGTPDELRNPLGKSTIRIISGNPKELAHEIARQFGLEPQLIGQELRIEQAEPLQLLTKLSQAFPAAMESVTVSKPTLEDVFIQRTGRRLSDDTAT